MGIPWDGTGINCYGNGQASERNFTRGYDDRYRGP